MSHRRPARFSWHANSEQPTVYVSKYDAIEEQDLRSPPKEVYLVPPSRNGVGPAGQCPEVCDSLALHATKSQHKLRWEEEIQELTIRVAPFEESSGRTLTGLVYALPKNEGCVAREGPTWRLYGGQTYLGAYGRERKETMRFIFRIA